MLLLWDPRIPRNRISFKSPHTEPWNISSASHPPPPPPGLQDGLSPRRTKFCFLKTTRWLPGSSSQRHTFFHFHIPKLSCWLQSHVLSRPPPNPARGKWPSFKDLITHTLCSGNTPALLQVLFFLFLMEGGS